MEVLPRTRKITDRLDVMVRSDMNEHRWTLQARKERRGEERRGEERRREEERRNVARMDRLIGA